MLVLFETPTRFAVFKVLNKGKLDKIKVSAHRCLSSWFALDYSHWSLPVSWTDRALCSSLSVGSMEGVHHIGLGEKGLCFIFYSFNGKVTSLFKTLSTWSIYHTIIEEVSKSRLLEWVRIHGVLLSYMSLFQMLERLSEISCHIEVGLGN